MTPKDIIGNNGIDIIGGYNTSLMRGDNVDCTIAHNEDLDIANIIIKTASSGYKMYRLVFFENENVKASLIRKKEGIYLQKIKWNILNKKDFDLYKKSLILKNL